MGCLNACHGTILLDARPVRADDSDQRLTRNCGQCTRRLNLVSARGNSYHAPECGHRSDCDAVKRCALGGFYCGVGRTGGQLSDEPTEVRRTNEFPSVLLTHQSLSRRKADGNKSFGRSGTCRRPTGREDGHLSGSDEREREGTTLSISKLERVGTSCRAFILQGVR